MTRSAMSKRTRTIWHSDEGLCYEMRRHFTRSVAEQKAKAFAKNPRFRMAVARPVKEGSYAVRLYPADHTALYQKCEARSQEKAAEQHSIYKVKATPDGSGWFIHNTITGGDYFITAPPEVTCTCPHWQTRLSVVGAPCKHIVHLQRFGYLGNDLELVP